jgi:hypothetical protein
MKRKHAAASERPAMSLHADAARRVAIVWRGATDAPDALRPDSGRLKAIFEGLNRRGLRPEPAPYDEGHSDAFIQRLHQMHAVLVWVNPLDAGRNRKALDDILREVAAAGVFVSAHPDVIARMGVKAVLHRTRTLGWGSDTRYYETPAAFATEFPKLLAHGPRVLKRNRGNGGIGVWKVESVDKGMVRVQEADGKAAIRVLPINEFIGEHRDTFFEDDGLLDQTYQPRLTEGMIRCYVSGQRVAGFGHQMVRALAPPEAGPAGRRLYSGPTDPRFQELKAVLERDWIPQMAELLTLSLNELPVIWDADFLLGPKNAAGQDSFVLCEINASSVFPIPDEAPDAIAATLLDRLARNR